MLLLGGMDELSAAAAVLAMQVDSESEEEMDLSGAAGERGGEKQLCGTLPSSAADKENNNVDLASGEVGPAIHKVTAALPMHIARPQPPPFTC